MTKATTEQQVRRRAKRSGCTLQKSRKTGDYRILDTQGNYVVFAPHFDATLEEVLEFLTEE